MKMSWAPALVLAAATAVSGIAMAQDNAAPAETAQAGEEQTIVAVVERINRAEGTITVSPGGVFKTPEGWSRGMVQEGTMVRITYTVQGEDQVATRIRAQAQ